MSDIKFNIIAKVGTNPILVTYQIEGYVMLKATPGETKDEKKRRKMMNAPKTLIIAHVGGIYYYLDTSRYYSLKEIMTTEQHPWHGSYDSLETAIAAGHIHLNIPLENVTNTDDDDDTGTL